MLGGVAEIEGRGTEVIAVLVAGDARGDGADGGVVVALGLEQADADVEEFGLQSEDEGRGEVRGLAVGLPGADRAAAEVTGRLAAVVVEPGEVLEDLGEGGHVAVGVLVRASRWSHDRSRRIHRAYQLGLISSRCAI